MIYIAGPFFTPAQYKKIDMIEALFELKKIKYYSPRSEGILATQNDLEKQRNRKIIFNKNIYNIDNCEIIVAVIDDRDAGTMWEMGYAYARDKRIITVSFESYGLNVMLAESVQAHIIGIEKLIEAIENPGYTGEIVKEIY